MSAFDDWRAQVEAQGGWISRMPTGGPDAGALCADYRDQGNTIRRELAPLAVRIEDGIDVLSGNVAQAEGKVADAAGDVLTAAGLDHGLPGLLGAALGVPYWVVLGVGVVVGYALLQGAGLVPPIRKVLK